MNSLLKCNLSSAYLLRVEAINRFWMKSIASQLDNIVCRTDPGMLNITGCSFLCNILKVLNEQIRVCRVCSFLSLRCIVLVFSVLYCVPFTASSLTCHVCGVGESQRLGIVHCFILYCTSVVVLYVDTFLQCSAVQFSAVQCSTVTV